MAARWFQDAARVRECLQSELDGETLNIRCPHCGSDYSHVKHVGTLLGSDEGEPESGVYPGTQACGKTAHRRSALQVAFECEGCDEPFALVVQQHKGVSMLFIGPRVRP